MTPVEDYLQSLKNGVLDSSYSYDLNSNRISGTQNSEQFTAVYDSQDRLLSYSQGAAPEKIFEYNLNGELTQIAQGSEYTSFTPDVLGRIKAATLPDYSTLSYRLDHTGRRVQKLKNGSLVYRKIYEDDFKVAAEVDPMGYIKEYVYATNINSADYMKVYSKHYRILKDHLGSPRLVVNASTGAIVQRMDYNEWGKVTLDTNPGFQPFGFAGGLYDQDTKLVKFGARDYDGSTGRWLSKDPILFNGGDTNLYGYVMQDPVNFIDPTGLIRNPGDIMDEALNHPNSSSGTNGAGNAFQHCFASCMMTVENGAFASFMAGHSFEAVNGMNGQSKADWAMDVSNNAKGRDLGSKCPINNWNMDNEKSKGISNYCANSCQNVGLTFMSM